MLGFLHKMDVINNDPIDYYLTFDDRQTHLNPFIGSQVTLKWTGNIQCVHCGALTSRSYSQGYCYPCFKKLAQCDLCVVNPDRCHFDEGTCRDNDFAESFCMQPHLVYLANSSGIKVGITKEQNLPDRWIDQGAVQAVPVVAVQTRQQSGFVEVAFGRHITDRTQWQRMLKADDRQVDLIAIRDRLMTQVADELDSLRGRFGIQAIQPLEAEPTILSFPVTQYPTRVMSMSFDSQPEVSGLLYGIKGQYLVFDTGVINIRKFTGYEVELGVQERDGHQTPGAQLSLL